VPWLFRLLQEAGSGKSLRIRYHEGDPVNIFDDTQFEYRQLDISFDSLHDVTVMNL